MGESFIIPLNDLKSGVLVRDWSVANEFFREFENEEVIAADLKISASAQKTGASILLDVDIVGTVTVPCDRCLDDVQMDIDTGASLKLRYGDGEDGADEEDGRELVWIPEGESQFDLSQTIYDYTCLALPIQRCHKEGECNPVALKHLTDNPGSEDSPEKPSENNPFASLQDLFKDK